MRVSLALPVLLAIGALIAWSEGLTSSSLRIVVLESLAGTTADTVLPAFTAAIRSHLAERGQTAAVTRSHIAAAGQAPPALLRAIGSADLVVTFGAPAAATARDVLAGSYSARLLAVWPHETRPARPPFADGDGPADNAAAALPHEAVFVIFEQLVHGRANPPLRVGLVYRTVEGAADTAVTRFAETIPALDFVPVPVTFEPQADGDAIVASVGAAAGRAMAAEPPIDGFWLALDSALPLDRLVPAIHGQTGRPVVYAPSTAAVAAGALMTLAPAPAHIGEEAAAMAMQLINGTAPSDVQMLASDRLEFAFNLRTAATLGIVPSHELMELARGLLFR